jgi:hypothetical protein
MGTGSIGIGGTGSFGVIFDNEGIGIQGNGGWTCGTANLSIGIELSFTNASKIEDVSGTAYQFGLGAEFIGFEYSTTDPDYHNPNNTIKKGERDKPVEGFNVLGGVSAVPADLHFSQNVTKVKRVCTWGTFINYFYLIFPY